MYMSYCLILNIGICYYIIMMSCTNLVQMIRLWFSMQRHDRTHSATASHVLLGHTVDIPFFLKRIIWDIFLTVLAIQHQKNVERLNSLRCVPRRSSNKTRGRGRLAICARARARTLSISRAFIRRAPVVSSPDPTHSCGKGVW